MRLKRLITAEWTPLCHDLEIEEVVARGLSIPSMPDFVSLPGGSNSATTNLTIL